MDGSETFSDALEQSLERLDREPGFSVYHVASGARNPIRVGEIFALIREYYRRHPMRNRSSGSPPPSTRSSVRPTGGCARMTRAPTPKRSSP